MTVYADDPARTPSDAKALSVSERSVRKSGRESFALCDEGGAVAVFEPANPERSSALPDWVVLFRTIGYVADEKEWYNINSRKQPDGQRGEIGRAHV